MHKISRSLLTLIGLGIGLCGYTQSKSNSPYSLAALGELKFTGLMQHRSQGGISRSLTDEYSFSPTNPASYANVKYTVYSVGADLSFGQLETIDQSAGVQNGNFNYFAMAFGIPTEGKRKMGVSFGFHELTSVGYEMRNEELLDTPAYYNLFRGTGGLSSTYVGFAISPIQNLNVGINTNFNFGNISSLKAKVYPYTKDYFSFSDEFYFYYRGFNVDLGVQYSIQDSALGKFILKHTFAATFHSKTSLSGTGYQYAETFLGIPFDQTTEIIPIDTLVYLPNLSNTLVKPMSFGLAYTISKKDNWGLSFEYEAHKWSSIKNELNGRNFFDNNRFSVGLYIIPKLDYRSKGEFWKKVEYRAGFRYENLYYNFFDQQLSEIGISFGLGLPIVRGITLSEERIELLNHIDLNVEFMQRGTTEHNLIKEQYILIGIGLNFNDKWFIKRKYQ